MQRERHPPHPELPPTAMVWELQPTSSSLGGINGDVLRLMLYLQHVSICGESIHNQASRDIQKPKPCSISITISKPVMVTNIILQMENHTGSGPVGNLG